MLNIIREGKPEQPSVYEFHCKKCDCVWETDEVRTEVERCSLVTVCDCPYCGSKNVMSFKLVR